MCLFVKCLASPLELRTLDFSLLKRMNELPGLEDFKLVSSGELSCSRLVFPDATGPESTITRRSMSGVFSPVHFPYGYAWRKEP
jgi:hypothetical protein